MKEPQRLSPFLIALATIVLVLIPVGAGAPAEAVVERSFTNPLVEDAADPTIEYWNGNYYLAATTWDNTITVRKAPSLAALGTADPIVVYSDTNPGRNSTMWAPELKRLNGPNGWRWYLMYTMGGANNTGPQRLHVIESATEDPLGPYAYKGRPLPIDDWHIDGAYLELDGSLYVVWSQFAPDGMQSNYIAKMTTPWSATGPLNILSQPTQSWERIGMPVNEGPVPLQRDGETWITYSASYCTTEDYQLATLRYNGGDPLSASSWVKSTAPVFSKANGVFGPGHNDFFTSPDGTQIWNAYHANPRADAGCGRERSMRAQPLSWASNGDPIFGQPAAPDTTIATPGGENTPRTERVEGSRWQLISRSSGLCASTSAAATDGAGLTLAACSSAGSTWKVDPTGDGYLRLVNAESGKTLDAANCGTADGTAVRQWSWLSNACQQWGIAETAAGWSTLTNRQAGKVLDVANCGSAAGTPVRLWSALANPCQEWSLRPVGAVAISAGASGKVLDIPECSTVSGAALQQWEWLNSPCQRMTFTPVADGRYEIHPASAPAQCLGVLGASATNGISVVQGACGSPSASWRVSVLPSGTVELRVAHTGKALDLQNCSLANGAKLTQWSPLANDCQQFRLLG